MPFQRLLREQRKESDKSHAHRAEAMKLGAVIITDGMPIYSAAMQTPPFLLGCRVRTRRWFGSTLGTRTTIVPRNQQGNHYGSNPTFTTGELDVLAAPKIGCTLLRQGYQSIRQVRRRTQRTGDIEIGAIIVQNKPLPLLPASVAIGQGHIVSRMVFVDCRLMK